MKKRTDITIVEWISGVPAITAAILARLVRFVVRKQGTKLEVILMDFYYMEEIWNLDKYWRKK